MRAFSNPNMDLKIPHIKLATLSVHTVEPLYNGHHWGPKFCQL